MPAVLACAAAGFVLVLALPMTRVDLGGRPFPAPALADRLRDRPGCVAHDYPMALIQMDLLQRDIDRGCRFVVDLGGYSYYLTDSPYADAPRRRNQDWQVLALDYFRTANAVIVIRFSETVGFSRDTAETIAEWPVIVQVGEFAVREPLPESR